MFTSGARAAAAAISDASRPVRATSSSTPMPNGASRTSRPMRAAGIRRGQRIQPRGDIVALAIAALAVVDDHAAADRGHGREHADDEAVAGQQQGRLAQHDAHVRGAAGRERLRAAEQPHLRFDLGRARVEMHRGAVLQRLGGAQQVEPAIDLFHRAETPGSARTSPRASSGASTSARLSAVRCPATARPALEPCTWTPRTRRVRPEG